MICESSLFVCKCHGTVVNENLHLQNAACVLVPGGFGDRGVKGMILAAKYARENKVPYLGICLGMQIAVIEFARSVSNTCWDMLPELEKL